MLRIAACVLAVAVAGAGGGVGAAGSGSGAGFAHGAAAKSGARLRWAPPRLVRPVTVNATASSATLDLDPHRDYVVQLPRKPLVVGGGLVVVGGHNVVIRGGEVDIPWQGTGATGISRRALYLKDQTGVVHVEGVVLAGSDISEGIDLAEPYAKAVQIENVRVMRIHNRPDEPFPGGQHPDLIQMWSGNPALRLRVDDFTGSSDYQGITLEPSEFGSPIKSAVFRNVNLVPYDVAPLPWTRYLLWRETTFPVRLHGLWVQPQPGRPCPKALAWPDPQSWTAVRCGTPTAGAFVPSDHAGYQYRTPGYRARPHAAVR